jgi:hypothetical protein
MSASGQKAKHSIRADVFGFGSENGHAEAAPQWLFRANNGLMQRNHQSPYSITFDQFEPGRHSGNLGTSGSRKSQLWPREV